VPGCPRALLDGKKAQEDERTKIQQAINAIDTDIRRREDRGDA